MGNSLKHPSRRQVLVSAAVSLAGVPLTTGCSQRRRPATFVLVHGASHGGWCWQRVADRLTAKGHRVFAPTLTGLCERSHLVNEKVDLTTHVNDIVNEIRWKDLDQVVLVGHSYGGMVITGVAEQVGSRLASIVYVDAFLPGDGQSLLDVVNQYAPGWTPPAGTFSGADFAAFMDVNEKDRAWVASKLTVQPPGTATEKLRISGAFLRVPRKSFISVTKGEQPFFKAVADRYRTDPACGPSSSQSRAQPVLGPVDQHNLGARCEHRPRAGEADPRGRAGDRRDLSVQRVGHAHPLSGRARRGTAARGCPRSPRARARRRGSCSGARRRG